MTSLLTIWDALAEGATRRVLIVGASNERAFSVAEEQSWPSLIRDKYSRFPSKGRGCRSTARPEWVTTGSFTKIDSGAADKSLHGAQRRLSGSGNIQTYTKVNPADTITGLVYVDASGSGNWSYSLDGAAYTASGAATLGDNALKTLSISNPVSTVAVRGANAAGTTVQCDLCGVMIEQSTGKVRYDNMAIDGHRGSGAVAGGLDALYRTTSGDALAMFDFLDPDLVLYDFGFNDLVNMDTDPSWQSTFETALGATIDRAHSINSDIIVLKWPESNNIDADRSFVNQAAMRTSIDTVTTAKSVPVADIYTAFGSSYSAGNSSGYFQGDGIHWSTTGHDLVAKTVWTLMAAKTEAYIRA